VTFSTPFIVNTTQTRAMITKPVPANHIPHIDSVSRCIDN
jgi:hypothetical protein